MQLILLNETSSTQIYTLSLHDALPIWRPAKSSTSATPPAALRSPRTSTCWSLAISMPRAVDRKSTRLNSSHLGISYAVFCLKKKKNNVNYQLDGSSKRKSTFEVRKNC